MSTAHSSITPDRPLKVFGNGAKRCGANVFGCLTIEGIEGGTMHSINFHGMRPEDIDGLVVQLKDWAAIWRGKLTSDEVPETDAPIVALNQKESACNAD